MAMASVAELQNKLTLLMGQLSLEQLQVLTDCATYLADQESEAATQEMLSIPGLLERVRQLEATPHATAQNWRSLRSDV